MVEKGGVMRPTRSARDQFCHGISAVLCFAAIVLTTNAAFAQLPQTQLGALSPAGGQAGTSFDVQVISGTDIDDLTALVFNHAGLKAVPKTTTTNGKTTPVNNTFVVTIGNDVPSGLYEVRVRGKFGLSNPRTFIVGRLQETTEKEPNNDEETPTPIKIGQTVNAVINGGADIDYYKFDGKQGQRVVIDCRAARIDSRLRGAIELFAPDGRRLAYSRNDVRDDPVVIASLPTDGAFVVKIYDFTYGGGQDYFYRLTIHTGPHIDFVMPASGKPGTTGKFTLYGRNIPGGQPTPIKIEGQAVQKIEVSIAIPANVTSLPAENPAPVEAGVYGISYTLKTPAGEANPVQIHLADAPVITEAEPNDDEKKPQRISVPTEVSGQFQARGDIDHFVFDAKKGETYYIEVYAERLGNSADAYLKLEQITKNKNGEEQAKTITTSDDNTTNLAANVFDTATDDPVYRFQVPADGTFRIALRDRYYEARGHARLVYRLSIRKPDPDFRAVILPETAVQNNNQPTKSGTLALRKGENLAARVLIFRQDGFDETVNVSAEGLPAGVSCKGAAIGPGQTDGYLIFTADEKAAEWAGLIRVVAKAKIKDEAKGGAVRDVTREVRPATIVWDGVNGRSASVARVARSLGLSVISESGYVQLNADVPRMEVNQGRQILVPLKLFRRNGFDNNVNITVAGMPRNTNIQFTPKAINKGKDSDLVKMFVNTNAKVGVYTIYLKTQAQIPYRKNLDKVDEAKKEQTEATKTEKTTADAAKAAAQALTNATNKANADAAKVKTAATTQTNAQKAATTANTAVNQAKTAKAQADKAVADATAAVKNAMNKAETATKAAAKDPKDKKAADALAAAQKELAAAQAAEKAAQAKQATADQALKTAEAAAKKAADDLTAANKALADAQTAAKASEAEKTKAAAASKDAADKAKAASDAKKAADAKVRTAEQVARPKNIQVFAPSTPIIIEVKPAPAKLSASVPNGGALKRGAKLDIKVTVNRTKDFKGPVTLSLPLPPDVKGLNAAAVTIPADKNDGVLSVQAAGDATEGQLQNLVVRATMDFNGKAAVDAPVTIKVNK